MTPRTVSDFDYLPRARVEAVIADARVVLALGALVAYWVEPQASAETPLHTLLLVYALYSLSAAALQRHGTWLSPAEQIIVHAIDLVAFSILIVATQPATSPYFVYFAFSVVCGALRWDARGAAATASVAIAAYVVLSLQPALATQEVDRLLIRSVQLMVLAGLLGFFSTYHPRVQRELLALASWPHRLPHDSRSVAAEVIERAAAILPAREVLLVWEAADESRTLCVSGSRHRVVWPDPPVSDVTTVAESFRDQDFQVAHAEQSSARVLLRSHGRFRVARGQPLDSGFVRRFAIRSAQSCCIAGELGRGRLFWIDRRQMRVDELIVGELVARLSAARLDAAHLLERLEESAALKERVRVARDLHDSLMQSLTGTSLQLAAAGRLLERDVPAARERLSVAREQVEETEHAMRNFVRRLRPVAPDDAIRRETIEPRLLRFAQRIEEQWPVKIVLCLQPGLERLDGHTSEEVLLTVREAVLNAARHAQASAIRIFLRLADDNAVEISISDDGKGFSFKGVYDLAGLNARRVGPRTLKERVAELGGTLQITSTDRGSEVRVSLLTGARAGG